MNYKLSHKLKNAPFYVESIFHDDDNTYIKLKKRAGEPVETPTPYGVKDGQIELNNFEVRNGVIIVHVVIDKGSLKVGKQSADFKRAS